MKRSGEEMGIVIDVGQLMEDENLDGKLLITSASLMMRRVGCSKQRINADQTNTGYEVMYAA